MSVLEVDKLTSGYSGVPVVRGVSLTVAPGEVVALLGANGAGKTTTLLAISGLAQTMSGEIRFDGQPITRLAPVRRTRIGIQHVPEDRSLFPSLTGAETLRLAAANRKTQDEVLGYFPALRQIMSRRVAVLSGGEQQMLALARALARNPRLLIVDEMSLGLAPRVVAGFFPVLRRVARERNCAVLLVEQHVRLALKFADRAYVMANGLIATSGTGAEMRDKVDVLTSAYLGDTAPSQAEPGGDE